jgi:hypothetical protein
MNVIGCCSMVANRLSQISVRPDEASVTSMFVVWPSMRSVSSPPYPRQAEEHHQHHEGTEHPAGHTAV